MSSRIDFMSEMVKASILNCGNMQKKLSIAPFGAVKL